MEIIAKAIATVGIWTAVAIVGRKNGDSGSMMAFLALFATFAIWI